MISVTIYLGFEGRLKVTIVPLPDHYISFTYICTQYESRIPVKGEIVILTSDLKLGEKERIYIYLCRFVIEYLAVLLFIAIDTLRVYASKKILKFANILIMSPGTFKRCLKTPNMQVCSCTAT